MGGMKKILQASELSQSQKQTVLGGVMLLSRLIPQYRQYSMAEWQRRILPAFDLNQFCYYEDGRGHPLAFCNWALVSMEVKNKLLSGDRDFIETDWQSGDLVFFSEIMAPFGHARQVVQDLRQSVFASRKGQQVCTVKGVIHAGSGYCSREINWFYL